jgi:hypothetical protein
MSPIHVVAWLAALTAVATADNRSLAAGHARSSATLYLTGAWSPGPMVPIRVGTDAAVRLHASNLALEVRLGAGSAATVAGLGSLVAGHAGVSLGGSFALHNRVAVAPMFAYDGFRMWEPGDVEITVHYGTVLVPITIVLRRGVVLEPFVQVGLARFRGTSDPVLVIGPRLGVVL